MKGKLQLQKFHHRPIRNFGPQRAERSWWNPVLTADCRADPDSSMPTVKMRPPGCKAA